MDYRIEWSESAVKDLKAIVEFIALDNPAIACRFGNEMVELIEQVARFPFSTRIVPEIGKRHIRECLVYSYRIVIDVSEIERLLVVLRIWHGRRGQPQLTQP